MVFLCVLFDTVFLLKVPSEINLDIIGGSGDARGDPLGIPLGRESENKDKSSVLLFGENVNVDVKPGSSFMLISP